MENINENVFKNETVEALLVCRACLATDRKLFTLNQYNLSDAYKNLIGIDVSLHDGLPQYICNFCAVQLIKYNAFRNICHNSYSILQDATTINQIITQENFALQTQYETTRIKILSITEEENINDHNRKQTNDDNFTNEYNHVNNDTPSFNPQIFTEDIKIENNHKQTKKTKIKKEKSFFDTKDKVQRGFFETKDNLKEFERSFNVNVVILNPEEQLKEFLSRKHSSNYLHSPYKCDLCYKGYMGADILNKHVLSQHDPKRGNIECDLCRFRYKDKRGLNQHLKSHRLKFMCKQCPYVSRTMFNAKEHYKMHGGQMHQCQHCGKTYEKMSSHLSHLRIRHPSHFIWCELCGDAFIGDFGLNAHKKRAHRHLSLPYICKSCDKSFASTTAFTLHSTNECSKNCCVHCGEAFNEAMELREHLLTKHRSNKTYECEKCKKTFKNESHYSAHYKRLHVVYENMATCKKNKQWICEICGKSMPNKCVLRYHQRNHTGEKPYHCTQCPKSFTMRKLLQSHLRVHTTDRPFVCKLCPKAFKGLSALKTHEHVHNDGHTKLTSKDRKL